MAITLLTPPAVLETPAAKTAAAKSELPAADIGRDAFLKLLVAQLKNQDPTKPSDGAQFIAQLAQFSQLEQTMSMKEDLAAIRTNLETAPTVAATEADSQ